MKVRVEAADLPPEELLILHGAGVEAEALARQLSAYADTLLEGAKVLRCYRRERGEEHECLIPYADILFCETETEDVYVHTAMQAYRVRQRLYELERLLPLDFVRISKSTLLHVSHVESVQRNLTASSPVTLRGTHKQVYVSRLYYRQLRERLEKRFG